VNSKRILQIKERLEDLKQKKHKAEGVLESLRKKLAEEFGCQTTKEAKAKIKKLENEVKELEEDLESKLKDYEEHYGKALG
jgi:archaellum component FlaC